MSYCKDEGKDKIVFVSEEDAKGESRLKLSEEEDEDDDRGLLHKDGSINWSCPCLGGMATGPCGYEFREAFSCFHNSKEEVKGSDCYETFREMQQCMMQYPQVYDDDDDAGQDDDAQSLEELTEQAEAEAEKLVSAQQQEKTQGVEKS